MRNRLYRSGTELLKEIQSTGLGEKGVAIWYLGQSSMMVKYLDTVLLFDPHLEDSLSKREVNPSIRNYPSPLDPALLDFVDYVLITHNHADHLEGATVTKIAAHNRKVQFVVPDPERDALRELAIPAEQIVGAKSDQAIQLGGLDCMPVAAAHYEIRRDPAGSAFALGYIVKMGPVTLYHSGDTIVYPELPQILKESGIDVAMLPINGRDWVRDAQGIIGNTNFKEAADLCDAIHADLFIPMHFDLYEHNTENPGYLVDYLYKRHPGMRYHIFQPGERYIYLKDR